MSCSIEQIWKVPPNRQNGQRRDMVWPTYLYHMIMKYDERLHDNSELCDAYNHLVDVLDTYQSICYTYTPEYMMDDYEYILLKEPEEYRRYEWESIPVRFYRIKSECWLIAFGHRVYQEPFVPQIYEAYMPLYVLMEKYGMLSWIRMNQIKIKQNEITKIKRNIKRIQKKGGNKEKEESLLEYIRIVEEEIMKLR
jgi:hypothetical protein